MTAAADIERTFRDLRTAGLDLGPPTSAVVAAHSGGSVRHHRNGDIYWHANTGAFEVHGGILAEYLRLGGPGLSAGGGRELGYPISHEGFTDDGRYPVSRFEFGSIYWVPGAGAIVVSGSFWSEYQSQGGDLGRMGLPIHSLSRVDDGDVLFLEFGCLLRRAGGPIRSCSIHSWPRPGRPTLVAPQGARLDGLFITGNDPALTTPDGRPLPGRPQPKSFVERAWSGHLVLRPVGGGADVALTVSQRAVTSAGGVTHHLDATPAAPLGERVLYDLAFVSGAGAIVTLSAHAVYAKQSWEQFGFMHLTDPHIARRNDRMHRYAMEIGATAGAAFANFNDGLRETIAVANNLHAAGKLDMVLATGDLVDYAFEDTDLHTGGGNFDLLVDIVRGRSPSPSGAPQQPLKVPIFMVPGNHDYRPNPYLLRFDIDVPVFADPSINNHEAFNLTRSEADTIQDELTKDWIPAQLAGMAGTHVGTVSRSFASSMVETKTPDWLLERIIGMAAAGSYTIRAGLHRIVMLDTGHDVGIVSGIGDAIGTYLGLTGEDEQTFIGGSPNQQGVTPQHLAAVKQALTDAGSSGVVIVGLHGPPLNPAGNEYGHYFRETEHPTADPREVAAFLDRRAPGPVPTPPAPTWSPTATPWFKRGSTSEFLDTGVSRGPIQPFLELVVGAAGRRPVDLVMCGHGHRRVDYRLTWDPTTRELRFHTDFYFDQPASYYPSKKAGHSDPVHIRIAPGAPLNGTPQSIRDQRTNTTYDELAVPPCADPQPKASNRSAWWKAHRPFIVQTPATGPLEASQRSETVGVLGVQVTSKPQGPTFRGVRIGQVAGPALVDLRSVRLDDARRQNYRV